MACGAVTYVPNLRSLQVAGLLSLCMVPSICVGHTLTLPMLLFRGMVERA